MTRPNPALDAVHAATVEQMGQLDMTIAMFPETPRSIQHAAMDALRLVLTMTAPAEWAPPRRAAVALRTVPLTGLEQTLFPEA